MSTAQGLSCDMGTELHTFVHTGPDTAMVSVQWEGSAPVDFANPL